MGTNMWDRAAEMAKRHERQGNGLWLKLANDGDKAVLVFLGEPYPREVCFVDGGCLSASDPKTKGMKPSLRVAFNVALLDSMEVKILELGKLFYEDVVRLKGKYGLENCAFEVERHGAARDPSTTYSILLEKQLTPEEKARLADLPLHNLATLYDDDASSETKVGSYDKTPAGAVDPKVAYAITAELKTLPREMVTRFLEEFGVARVRDLKAEQADAAREFVELLKSEADRDTDPFG